MQNTEIKDKQYIKMTETPIPKLISTLAIPTIISMVVTAIYNMADTYFVSMLNDTSATGAVSIVFALMAMIQAVGFTIGMGSGSWISRLLGQKRKDDANSVAISALFLALFCGLVIMTAGRGFVKPLMTVIGATDTILPYACDYGQYILYAAPGMAMAFTLNNILRSEGKARLSMIGITSGGILNMILDPVFIFAFDMKTAGAAVATAISQYISFIILLVPFLMKKTTVRLSVKSLSKKLSTYVNIIKFGIPSFLRQGLASIATIVMSNSAKLYAGVYADSAIAAMGVVSRVFMFLFSIILGIGQGYQPVLGYNYGAKKYKRTKSAFKFCFISCTIIFIILGTLGFIFAPFIINLFNKGAADEKMLEIGVAALRAQCISMPFVPIGVVCNMTYQSLGKSFSASLLACLRQGLFYIPVMIILPKFLGLAGVEYTQAIADFLTAVLAAYFAVKFFKEISGLEASGGMESNG